MKKALSCEKYAFALKTKVVYLGPEILKMLLLHFCQFRRENIFRGLTSDLDTEKYDGRMQKNVLSQFKNNNKVYWCDKCYQVYYLFASISGEFFPVTMPNYSFSFQSVSLQCLTMYSFSFVCV